MREEKLVAAIVLRHRTSTAGKSGLCRRGRKTPGRSLRLFWGRYRGWLAPMGGTLSPVLTPRHLRHHDASMRTTLTLDEDLAGQLHDLARRKGESFKQVVNSTLRRGLQGQKGVSPLPRFKVTPKACGFRSGVDVLRLNQLTDELEVEDFQRKLAAAGGNDPA
jgi:hypothetical protein